MYPHAGSGGVGIYADGTATFDSFIVKTSCDVGNTCVNMYDGSMCSYSCQAGFYYLGASTYMCGQNGKEKEEVGRTSCKCAGDEGDEHVHATKRPPALSRPVTVQANTSSRAAAAPSRLSCPRRSSSRSRSSPR
jgi:hypothetical protein